MKVVFINSALSIKHFYMLTRTRVFSKQNKFANALWIVFTERSR